MSEATGELLILTLDTRGDVQPFVALPRGLANAGHEAVLAAPHRFEGFVRDQGVPFAGIDDCWSVTAEGPGAGADILVHNGHVVDGEHVAESWGSRPCWRCRYPWTCRLASFPGRA